MKPVHRKQRQFSIRHLLFATLAAATAITLALRFRDVLPDYRMLVFWSVTVLAGIVTRWLGWIIPMPPGSLGRHALSFFFACIGCAGMIVLLNYNDSWTTLMRDIPEGVGAAAIIFGIVAGACIESVFWLLPYLRLGTIGTDPMPDDSMRSGESGKDVSRRPPHTTK